VRIHRRSRRIKKRQSFDEAQDPNEEAGTDIYETLKDIEEAELDKARDLSEEAKRNKAWESDEAELDKAWEADESGLDFPPTGSLTFHDIYIYIWF
jgi:hypothetical protein